MLARQGKKAVVKLCNFFRERLDIRYARHRGVVLRVVADNMALIDHARYKFALVFR